MLSTSWHHILLLITLITIIALISLITIISIITTIIRYLVSLQVWTELLARLLLINIIATINLVNFPNHVPQQNGFDHPTDIQIHVSWWTQLNLPCLDEICVHHHHPIKLVSSIPITVDLHKCDRWCRDCCDRGNALPIVTSRYSHTIEQESKHRST